MATNQITELLDPAQMPNQDMDQLTFDALWAAVLRALPNWGRQVNEMAAGISSLADGSAYALTYLADLSSTTDADPTAGKLRFNNATQAAATALYLDLLGADTTSYTSILDQFDASTSAVKGQIRLVKQGDPSKFLTFDVTGRTTATGYRKLAVTNTSSSSASPFGPGDAILLKFTRNGDRGDAGPTGSSGYQLLASATISSAVANVDFLSIFTSGFDRYVIDLQGLTLSSAAAIRLQLAKAGAVDAAAVYGTVASGSGTGDYATSTSFTASSTAGHVTLTMDIRNANSISGQKGFSSRGMYQNPGISPPYYSAAYDGVYLGANTVTGFRLSCSSTFTAGTIRVFGVKNT